MVIDTGFLSRVRFRLWGAWAWLKESHRVHHLAGGFLVGLVFGFLAAVSAGAAMEFKECQMDKLNSGRSIADWNWRRFDWADFGMTCLGGALGGLLNFLFWRAVL